LWRCSSYRWLHLQVLAGLAYFCLAWRSAVREQALAEARDAHRLFETALAKIRDAYRRLDNEELRPSTAVGGAAVFCFSEEETTAWVKRILSHLKLAEALQP
jgi:hypothetical protein